MTTAVKVNIAAEAPAKFSLTGKNGRLNGKLRMPPRKKADNIFLASATPSRVFPNTYRKIMLPRR